jgi:hypothetical protein
VFCEDGVEDGQAEQEKEGEKATFLQRRFLDKAIGEYIFSNWRFFGFDLWRFIGFDLNLDYDSGFMLFANRPPTLLYRSGFPTP